MHASRHLCLRDELRDLLAGVERRHLHVSHTPVGPAWRIQDLVMFLQDLAETGEVQVLRTEGCENISRPDKQTGGWIYSCRCACMTCT